MSRQEIMRRAPSGNCMMRTSHPSREEPRETLERKRAA
jgi:hypothetical protein